jgi:hypothetical protein
MLSLIEDTSIILQNNLSEYMCVFDSSKLEEFSEQWKYNRNLSNEKIQSICNNIKDKYILDTVLHFFYVNDNGNEKLICFDGNHRREALILLYKKSTINIKVCCYIYKCKDVNHIDKEIVDKFNIINQMTPIPDIYNDIVNNLGSNDNLINKKNIIEEVYKSYKNNYKAFYSVNSKCRKPNFNETTFKDLCNMFEFSSKNELINKLEELNDIKRKKIFNTLLSQNQRAKCESQKFYLFS